MPLDGQNNSSKMSENVPCSPSNNSYFPVQTPHGLIFVEVFNGNFSDFSGDFSDCIVDPFQAGRSSNPQTSKSPKLSDPRGCLILYSNSPRLGQCRLPSPLVVVFLHLQLPLFLVVLAHQAE
jgi:hypothetical protein